MDAAKIEIGKTYAFQHIHFTENTGTVTITASPGEVWGEDKETGMWTAVPVPNPHNETWGVYADELSEIEVDTDSQA